MAIINEVMIILVRHRKTLQSWQIKCPTFAPKNIFSRPECLVRFSLLRFPKKMGFVEKRRRREMGKYRFFGSHPLFSSFSSSCPWLGGRVATASIKDLGSIPTLQKISNYSKIWFFRYTLAKIQRETFSTDTRIWTLIASTLDSAFLKGSCIFPI